jgi:hypothetical protein
VPGQTFDYAIVRVVPRVERGEAVNVGVILFCRTAGFLGARVHVDRARLVALWPGLDVEAVARAVEILPRIAAGEADAGPIAELPQADRFHWLVAPRSTVVQTSAVHTGLCDEPGASLSHLFAELVLPLGI